MRCKMCAIVLVGGSISLPALAHHSKANFLNETIVLQGEIVSFRWVNPHALFTMTVHDATGKTTEWEVKPRRRHSSRAAAGRKNP